MTKKLLTLFGIAFLMASIFSSEVVRAEVNLDDIAQNLPARGGRPIGLRHDFAGGGISVLFQGWGAESREKLSHVVRAVQIVFNSKAFEDALRAVGQGAGFVFNHQQSRRNVGGSLTEFEHNIVVPKITGAMVFENLVAQSGLNFSLKPYRPLNPFSAARAYAANSTVHLNTYKFSSKSLEDQAVFLSYCNTVAHELTHLFGYSHAGGKGWNRNSVPYAVGDIVQELLARVVL